MIIDTHSHLFDEAFADDLDEVVGRARAAGVGKILMPNIDDTTVDALLDACSRYPGYLYPMLGFHPTSVLSHFCYTDELDRMEQLLQQPDHPFVAVGEVGLDLYWDQTYREEQHAVFERQIGWAIRYQLPLVIHARACHSELVAVMERYAHEPLTGIFHSFTGTVEEAGQLLQFPGFMLGINGVVTFKKSDLGDQLRQLPLDRLVLETDSPYLSPVPHRGKRNESAFIVSVAERLAQVYNLPVADVISKTEKNARLIFKKVT